MYIEFGYYVRSLLRALDIDAVLRASHGPEQIHKGQICTEQEKAEFTKLSRCFVLERCPKPEQGLVSTPLLFKVSSFLVEELKCSMKDAAPAVLAKILIEQSNHNVQPEFLVSMGGLGYLNGEPSEIFSRAFLKRMFFSGTQAAFSFASLRAPREELFYPGPLRAQVGLLTLFDELKARDEEFAGVDFPSLLQSTKRSIRDTEFSLGVMLLAMQADPEISIQAFLRGACGRENIPWYLKQFLNDVRSATEVKTSREMDSCRRQGESEKLKDDSPRFLVCVEQSVAKLRELMFEFRFLLLRAVRDARPELLLAAVLKGVQEFYKVWNHPNGRQLALAGKRLEAVAIFLEMAKFFAAIVSDLPSLLYFSCDNSDSVLNVQGDCATRALPGPLLQ